MFSTKLVEKDVEVVVTQKRIVEVYEFDGETFYNKRSLREYLEKKIAALTSQLMFAITIRSELSVSNPVRYVCRKFADSCPHRCIRNMRLPIASGSVPEQMQTIVDLHKILDELGECD